MPNNSVTAAARGDQWGDAEGDLCGRYGDESHNTDGANSLYNTQPAGMQEKC